MTRLLEPAGLGEQQLSATLGSVMRGGIDYADLYFEVSRQESWTLEDGIIREGSFSLDQGVGVRANSGEKTGFAYSDELVLPEFRGNRIGLLDELVIRHEGRGTSFRFARVSCDDCASESPTATIIVATR